MASEAGEELQQKENTRRLLVDKLVLFGDPRNFI